MKITIIGPLCSGKSTLGTDLAVALNGGICLEEAHRYFHSIGIDVPISEKTTKESSLKLFDFSCKQVKTSNDSAINYVILGSPFDEFMYTFHAKKTASDTELDNTFLLSLVEQTKTAMSEFDLIFRVTDFQSIPYYCDNVRPDKDDSYRNEVDQTINELLASEPPFEIMDLNIKSRIKLVSGSREERVQQCLGYIMQAGYKETIKMAVSSISNGFFNHELHNSKNQRQDMSNNFPPAAVSTDFNKTTSIS